MHTHSHRPSMSSSPACVDKYICVRVCPLWVDHNAQLARRERPKCVSVVRSGAPSLSTFSTIQALSVFSSSCPSLFLTLPSSLLVTFWHVRLSVCLFCPDSGHSQLSSSANIQTHADGSLKKKKGDFLELQRHMHLEMQERMCRQPWKQRHWYFHSVRICRLHSCRHLSSRSRTPPFRPLLLDIPFVWAATTLRMLKHNTHCAIPNTKDHKKLKTNLFKSIHGSNELVYRHQQRHGCVTRRQNPNWKSSNITTYSSRKKKKVGLFLDEQTTRQMIFWMKNQLKAFAFFLENFFLWMTLQASWDIF